MKTFEDCLDEIAVRYNYKDWEQFLTDCADTFNNPTDEIFKAMRKAALLYGQAKWNQACDIQREVCAACYMAVDVLDVTDEDYDEYRRLEDEISAIKSAPKPPFKP